jgi:hypothetical protein
MPGRYLLHRGLNPAKHPLDNWIVEEFAPETCSGLWFVGDLTGAKFRLRLNGRRVHNQNLL